MDIIVAKKDILPLLSRAASVADKKNTMPVLANVLLSAYDGLLSVQATDLYLSTGGSVTCKTKSLGCIAVPARDMLDRVKAMPDGPMSISVNGAHQMAIKAIGAARRFTMRGIPGAEFPSLPHPGDGATRVAIGGSVLAALVASVMFAVSPDDTRPNLNSALIEFAKGRARAVATDGHRLAMREIDATSAFDRSILIPLRGLREMGHAAEGADQVTVIVDGQSVYLEMPSGLLGVKLTEAVFPSYQQVIPKSHMRTAIVPRAALADAIRCMSLAASDRTSGIRLEIRKGAIGIKGDSPENGNGEDEVPAEVTGDDLITGVSARYMLDALGAMSSDDVVMEFGDELAPVVIRPSGDASYTAVIMPMRV